MPQPKPDQEMSKTARFFLVAFGVTLMFCSILAIAHALKVKNSTPVEVTCPTK